MIAMMIGDAQRGASTVGDGEVDPAPAQRTRGVAGDCALPRLVPQPAGQSVGQLETRKGA